MPQGKGSNGDVPVYRQPLVSPHSSLIVPTRTQQGGRGMVLGKWVGGRFAFPGLSGAGVAFPWLWGGLQGGARWGLGSKHLAYLLRTGRERYVVSLEARDISKPPGNGGRPACCGPARLAEGWAQHRGRPPPPIGRRIGPWGTCLVVCHNLSIQPQRVWLLSASAVFGCLASLDWHCFRPCRTQKFFVPGHGRQKRPREMATNGG